MYRLPLLLEQIINRHPPSGHGWLCVCDFPAPKDHRMIGVARLVGLNDILAQ